MTFFKYHSLSRALKVSTFVFLFWISFGASVSHSSTLCQELLAKIFAKPTLKNPGENAKIFQLPNNYKIDFPVFPSPKSLFEENPDVRFTIMSTEANPRPIASVRMEIDPGRLAHEVFTTDFFEVFGNFNVHRIRLMSQIEITDFVKLLETQNPLAYDLLVKELAKRRGLPAGTKNLFPERMTLTEWIPNAQTGEEILEPFRLQTLDLPTASMADPKYLNQIQTYLQSVAPNLHKVLDQAFLFATITGVVDFHAGNWLRTPDGKIWIIDFAQCELSSRYEFFQAKRTFYIEAMHPYLTRSVDFDARIVEFIKLAIGSLTEEQIETLGSLNKKTLQELARKSGFEIPAKKLEQMLKRAEFIYNLATAEKK